MKYFLIIQGLLVLTLMAQSQDSIAKKQEITVFRNPKLFKYEGFIIDTVRTNGNSVCRTVNGMYPENSFYDLILPTIEDVEKIELALVTKRFISQKFRFASLSKLMFKNYRQYWVYRKSADTLGFNIYFCTKEFYKEIPTFNKEVVHPVLFNHYFRKHMLYVLELWVKNDYTIVQVANFIEL